MSEHFALLSLAATLLGAIIISTWRFATLSTKLLVAVKSLEDKEKQQDDRLSNIDALPKMQQQLEFCSKHLSLVPKMESRLAVMEAKFENLREWRRVSRPDLEDE